MTTYEEAQIAEAHADPLWARVLALLVRLADVACRWTGYVVAFAALGTVLVCFATVYLRYALGMNFMWLQELVVWQHVMVIALGAAYTMMTGGFVRVDIFYSSWPVRRRAAMDAALTVLLLIPFLAVFTWFTWTFWLNSWNANEGSMNPGGLPNLWLLKGTLLGFCFLIGLQAIAILARGALVLSGREHWALQHGGHGEPAPAAT
jgi:TRAP-type mannitol/chloroaromatic compound transport system permease small subunit